MAKKGKTKKKDEPKGVRKFVWSGRDWQWLVLVILTIIGIAITTITLCTSKKFPKLDLELKKATEPGKEVCLLLVNTGEVSASQVKVKIYMPKNIGNWSSYAAFVKTIKEEDTLLIADYKGKTILPSYKTENKYPIEIYNINKNEFKKANRSLKCIIECKETDPVEKIISIDDIFTAK